MEGDLSDASWQVARGFHFVEVVSGLPPVNGKTEGRLLWDDRYLYIGLQAKDADIWGTLNKHDDALCSEEVLEVFVDPDGDGRRYVEMEINPLNAILDLRYAPDASGTVQGDSAWDAVGLLHAVTVEGSLNDPNDIDRRWTAVIALPWDALRGCGFKSPLPPHDGDKWRMNFCRIERPRRAASAGETVEYTAWSPPGEVDFHLTERFGAVLFTAAAKTPDSDATGGGLTEVERQ